MKKIFSALFLFLLSGAVMAQEEEELKIKAAELKPKEDTLPDGWRKGGIGSLTFAQVSLSNWASGGQNSVALNAAVNLFANLKKGHSTWDNNLDLGYGLVKQGTENLRKSDDRIDFSSKYGRNAFKSKAWYYAGLVNFRSQFAPGYNYPNDSVIISKFMAPGYMMLAIGMDYKPIPNLTAFLSPVTSKMTFVNDQTLADAGAFGVTKAEYDTAGVKTKDGSRFRAEIGGYFKLTYKVEIGKTATFQTKVDLFSNYAHNPQNIDIQWENSLIVKVGKYIGITFGTLLIYDDDVMIAVDNNGDGAKNEQGPRTQFRQVFGVGFSYKFSNGKK